jgi:hypothetical protein
VGNNPAVMGAQTTPRLLNALGLLTGLLMTAAAVALVVG